MWMEERVGERINVNRTTEAVGTGADQIAIGCPFCRVMLSDGLTALQAKGEAREEVEVLDVAQLLLASVKQGPAPAAEANDDEADDSGFPLTVAHDGTMDPEQAPAVKAASREPQSPDPGEREKPNIESTAFVSPSKLEDAERTSDTDTSTAQPAPETAHRRPGQGATAAPPPSSEPEKDGDDDPPMIIGSL
jgi:hypothetical protein